MVLANLSDHIACFKLYKPILAEDPLTFSYRLFELLLRLLERLEIFGFYIHNLT